MKTFKMFTITALCIFFGLAAATGYMQLVNAIVLLAPTGLAPYVLMALLAVGIAGFLVIGYKVIEALDKRWMI